MIQLHGVLLIRIASALTLTLACLGFGCARPSNASPKLQRFQLKGETGTLGTESSTHLTRLTLVEAVPSQHQPSQGFQLEIGFSSGETIVVPCAVVVDFTDNVVRADASGQIERLGVATSWSWVAYTSLPQSISVIKFIEKGKIIAVQEFNPPINPSTASKRWPNQSPQRTQPQAVGPLTSDR